MFLTFNFPKDLLMSLGHTNTYVRQDGLNGLLELVKKNETDVLVPRLSQIITGVAPCLFDIDVLIRSVAIKFIEVLLVKVKQQRTTQIFWT